MNGPFFPDVYLNATTWTGPPSGIVTVQFRTLYTSLATSPSRRFPQFSRNSRSTVPQEPWWFRCRQKPGQATESRRAGEVVLPPANQKPSSDASARLAVARLRSLAVSLDDQPRHRWRHPRLHAVGVASCTFACSLWSLEIPPSDIYSRDAFGLELEAL